MNAKTFLSIVMLACAAAGAQAQVWPSKPIRIITPTTPGSPPDVLARALGERLRQKLGQMVLVENRPGANTVIGMQACKAAAPDGYTFCLTTNDSMSFNPHLYNKLPYNPEKDFEPVALLAWPNGVIVAGASLGAKTLQDVVALSRTRAEKLNWGSFGNGSTSHLYLEWIRKRTDWSVTHIPYNNPGLAIQAVMGGQVQLTYLTIGALKGHIDSGKLVPLAVAGTQRSSFLPTVPTFSEAGLGDFRVLSWFGLFAPAGTPADVVVKLNAASVEVVNDPAFRAATMDALTLSPGKETPAEMKAYMKKDLEASGELVRLANFKLD